MNEWQWQQAKIEIGVLRNKFIIVIPCYNAADTIENAVLSVLDQDFRDLGIVIRNDMSTDQTGEVVRKIFEIQDAGDFYIKSKNRDVIYIENTKKLYGGGNTYESVLHFVENPNAIVGVVDGDDFLLALDAVSTIYDAYQQNPEKWLIWSQHVSRVQSQGRLAGYSLPLPPDQVIYRTRRYWGVSHFRTCLAGLFHHIDPADLSDPYDQNAYPKVCGDAALLYPMIEMCGNRHSLYINKLLYYYNDGLPTNDAEVYKDELEFYKRYFEGKRIYAQLAPDHQFK
jgi:glycosyltransferase involved in cell wall biosynthesis